MANSELYSSAHQRISNHFGEGLPGRKEAVRMFSEAIAKYLAFPTFTLGEERAPVDTVYSYMAHVTTKVTEDSHIPGEVKGQLLDGLAELVGIPERVEAAIDPVKIVAPIVKPEQAA